ncbi:UDP-N-acetylglucosamine 4,6-dehydratase (inverting) [Koleobacter methoxysyntrophicus]|uniref:UDP-N-acetylglucosamine 4,6-dehydratase (Inverting) n=1 Tax=Koleobacter methoxysyntrophicus TaxID=2751313 RepID=A0A8A0RR82_9FIRM|nr:UDP-N-acetylglucosamine 4,6-dehydratase family protein [Koleobacter methoxysyntrophicus]QSQ10402.1 UDP-N-acetylglucosamine 4,6-dehydratase (inverting) [Koleobacter methoxysyntrophicus]
MDFFKGKKILVIGGTGSLGRVIIRKLIKFNPEVIRVFSRDEAKQYEMQWELSNYSNIRFLLGDVRDYKRLLRAMEDIDIVFNTAALKHVPACEYNPFEAVKTNVLGTQNVIEAALNCEVEKVIYTSTDKAISPTNTMGATKLLAERLISAADYYKGNKKTVFTAVRFGNVIGSRGSVIPLFERQIREKKEVTITNGEMTRFMMTISQAVDLTLEAAKRAQGGEIFVLKMPVIKLNDLVEVVIEEFSKKYKYTANEVSRRIIGLRPGEKLYEELMTEEEAKYALELDNMFIIPPLFTKKCYNYEGVKPFKNTVYSSQNQKPLNKEEIKNLLKQEEII